MTPDSEKSSVVQIPCSLYDQNTKNSSETDQSDHNLPDLQE